MFSGFPRHFLSPPMIIGGKRPQTGRIEGLAPMYGSPNQELEGPREPQQHTLTKGILSIGQTVARAHVPPHTQPTLESPRVSHKLSGANDYHREKRLVDHGACAGARTHTHACTHPRTYVRTHACTHQRTHARTHACTHMLTFTGIYGYHHSVWAPAKLWKITALHF